MMNLECFHLRSICILLHLRNPSLWTCENDRTCGLAWCGQCGQKSPARPHCERMRSSTSFQVHFCPYVAWVRHSRAMLSCRQWQSQQPQFRKTWETARPRNDEQTNPCFLQTSRIFINFHTFSDTHALFMPYAMPPVQIRRAKNSSALPSRRRLSGGHAPWRQPWELQQGFFRNIEKQRQKLSKIDKNTFTSWKPQTYSISNTDASVIKRLWNHKKTSKKSYDFSAMQHALNWKPTEKPMIFWPSCDSDIYIYIYSVSLIKKGVGIP